MLELQFNWKKYNTLGLIVLLTKWLPLTAVMTVLVWFGVTKLTSHVPTAVAMFVIAALGLWKFYKLSVRVLAYLTLRGFLKVTVGKDDVQGTTAFNKPIFFKKNEIHNVIFEDEGNVYYVGFTINRPKFKFLGKARFVAYDLYLTEESFKDLKKLFSYRWGGSIRTKTIKGKDVLAWQSDK